jgi:hypothetical protein
VCREIVETRLVGASGFTARWEGRTKEEERTRRRGETTREAERRNDEEEQGGAE